MSDIKAIKPIKLGEFVFNPVILAPMAGITDYPFRHLARRFGAGLTVSEMISSEAMVRKNEKSLKLSKTAREEYPLLVQIVGKNPILMAEAARINESMGAAAIDINMGCPQPKIVRTGAGAALMRDKTAAAKVIEAVVKAVSIPVTIKIRLGWDHTLQNAKEIAKTAEGLGVSLITVHGRTRNQFFSGRVDWALIKEVKDAVSIPVIANGDICDSASAHKSLIESGADGVMIGRGALGRPWIFSEILACLLHKGDKDLASQQIPPTIEDQYAVILEHLWRLEDFYGLPVGLWMARKHLGWYSKGLAHGSTFRRLVNKAQSFKELRLLINTFYEKTLEFLSAETSSVGITSSCPLDTEEGAVASGSFTDAISLDSSSSDALTTPWA